MVFFIFANCQETKHHNISKACAMRTVSFETNHCSICNANYKRMIVIFATLFSKKRLTSCQCPYHHLSDPAPQNDVMVWIIPNRLSLLLYVVGVYVGHFSVGGVRRCRTVIIVSIVIAIVNARHLACKSWLAFPTSLKLDFWWGLLWLVWLLFLPWGFLYLLWRPCSSHGQRFRN